MPKIFCLVCLLSLSYVSALTLQEVEEQNRVLEAQIKQEELKQKLQKIRGENLTPPPPLPSPNTEPISQEDLQSLGYKDEKRTSLLLGFGLGVTQGQMYLLSNDKLVDMGLPLYNAFLLNAQVGGMTMWNRYFGIEYFYNLDLMFDDSLKNVDISSKVSDSNGQVLHTTMHYDIFGILSTSTFNVNAIANVYNSDNFGFGFFAGFGIGVDISKYSGTYYGEFESSISGAKMVSSTYSIDYWGFSFDMRANLGARFIFKDNYALSLNCSIPFLANVIDPTTAVKDNVAFSVRFVYGGF